MVTESVRCFFVRSQLTYDDSADLLRMKSCKLARDLIDKEILSGCDLMFLEN